MYKVTKKKVHGLLHPEIVGDERWDKIINVFIIVLIILNVVAVILETVKSINNRYEEFFHYFDNHEEKYKHSVWGRLKYMFSAGALIDLIAIAPSYMHSIIGIDLRVLRMMRLMRLFRLFRLTAYMKSAQMITNVFKKRANELALTFILAALLIIIASCIIYFTEHLYPTEKTSLFTSIPATIWWAIVTLTTTGYGDMIPLTDLGKFMSGIIMLTGVAFFALPAGIITAGFLEEFRINRIKKTHKCPNCGEDLNLENNHHHDENGK